MSVITKHSHCRAGSIPPVANMNVTSPREATIARWPLSEIEPLRELAFAAGQTVFHDGDEAEFFFEIVTGTLRCCRITDCGRRQIYRFAEAGEVLGLGGKDRHNYSAEAVTEVVVRRHPLMFLNAAMAKDHQLRERVLQSLRDELAAMRAQMNLRGQLNAVERVASFLIDLSERNADPDGWLHLPMTRCEIGDYLGLTMETVSRRINELKRLRVIEMKAPNEIRIAAHDRLAELAQAA
jgi:CRP-like cAMP-binding protein